MRILVAGGTGFLGSALVGRLRAGGHDVTVLTRRPRGPGEAEWDPAAADGRWIKTLDGSDTVINLAGESIAGERWTPRRKVAIRDSRVRTTLALVDAMKRAPRPPATFVNASAVGYYGSRGDEPLTEDSGPGTDFLSDVCRAWEAAALSAPPPVRVVLLRTGLVFDRGGGALEEMALPFRLMAGGPVGSGRQYMSWIHREDWTAMVLWTLGTTAVAGPLNVTSPNPVSNREFARTLGRVLRRPSFLPAPYFALRVALGEVAEALVSSQRALPAKAQSLGFSFRYADLEQALRAIYGD